MQVLGITICQFVLGIPCQIRWIIDYCIMSWFCLWYSLLSVWMPLHHDTTLAFLQKRPVPTLDTPESDNFQNHHGSRRFSLCQAGNHGSSEGTGMNLLIGLTVGEPCLSPQTAVGVWVFKGNAPSRGCQRFCVRNLMAGHDSKHCHVPESDYFTFPSVTPFHQLIGWQESDYPFVEMPFDGILGKPGALLRRLWSWCATTLGVLQGHWKLEKTALLHPKLMCFPLVECCRFLSQWCTVHVQNAYEDFMGHTPITLAVVVQGHSTTWCKSQHQNWYFPCNGDTMNIWSM